MNITQKIAAQLVELGYVENTQPRTRKYREFFCDGIEGIQGYKYYLGKRGALRKGKTVSSSISITDVFRKKYDI